MCQDYGGTLRPKVYLIQAPSFWCCIVYWNLETGAHAIVSRGGQPSDRLCFMPAVTRDVLEAIHLVRVGPETENYFAKSVLLSWMAMTS